MRTSVCCRLLDHSLHFRARPAAGRSQRGAVLVIGLIILVLVSLVSVTGANRALLSEKMASNHYTQTKAFLAAETGISDAVKVANTSAVTHAVAGGNAEAIETAWDTAWAKQNLSLSGPNPIGSGETFNIFPVSNGVYWNPTNKTFEVESKGSLNTNAGDTLSTRTLIAQISAATLSSPNSPFLSAVVGQQGVTLKGGSGIDIYNSSYGAYGSQVTVNGNTFKNSSIDSVQLSGLAARTCTTDGLISLSGNSPVYGDLIGTGGLQATGATPVYGNIHVNNDANFNGHVYGNLTAGGKVTLGNASTVEGDILSGGNLSAAGSLRGDAYVYGDANFTNSSSTSSTSTVKATGDVNFNYPSPPPQQIIAGGSINYPQGNSQANPAGYSDHLTNISLPTITPVTANQSDCTTFQNSDNLSQMFDTVRNDSNTQFLSDWLDANQCTSQHACYSQKNGGITLKSVNYSGNLTIGKSGQQTTLKVAGNVMTGGILADLYIDGDVTLLVDGNFNLGGATTLHIGASDSLKLLITGTTTLSSGSNLQVDGPFVRADSKGQPVPAVAVYSNYDTSTAGGYGVTVAGANSSYVAVYAPKATVDITGSGDIYGSVVAQKIDQSGSGAIHYDEALKNVTIGSGSHLSTAAKLVSWQQIQSD